MAYLILFPVLVLELALSPKILDFFWCGYTWYFTGRKNTSVSFSLLEQKSQKFPRRSTCLLQIGGFPWDKFGKLYQVRVYRSCVCKEQQSRLLGIHKEKNPTLYTRSKRESEFRTGWVYVLESQSWGGAQRHDLRSESWLGTLDPCHRMYTTNLGRLSCVLGSRDAWRSTTPHVRVLFLLQILGS